jgi:hypothetical protein
MNRREMLCMLSASVITGAGSMLDGRATRGLFGKPSLRGTETLNPDVVRRSQTLAIRSRARHTGSRL